MFWVEAGEGTPTSDELAHSILIARRTPNSDKLTNMREAIQIPSPNVSEGGLLRWPINTNHKI